MASGAKKPESENNNRLSTESKESSYMGFDRGIDSDIEIDGPVTPTTGPQGIVGPPGNTDGVSSASRCSSEPHLKRKMILTPKLARWESLDPPEPTESQNLLAADAKTPDFSKADGLLSVKPIANKRERFPKENKVPLPPAPMELSKAQANHKNAIPLVNTTVQDAPTATPAQEPLTSVGSFTSIGSQSAGLAKNQCCFYSGRINEHDSLLIMLSGIYAKLLIVMGLCFPLAEVISRRIPVSYYEGFYLYLYTGSIAFLLFVYIFILRAEAPQKRRDRLQALTSCLRLVTRRRLKSSPTPQANIGNHNNPSRSSSIKSLEQQLQKQLDEGNHCGNFYLRLGAVGFGIGSMIYSGLEFGQFFELEAGTDCYSILYGITPTARMVFTFIQMYFIFLNSRMSINKYKALARFGLMHMIATNLCVWLHILVQETKHGILTLISFNMSAPLASQIPMSVLAEVVREENLTVPTFDSRGNHSRVYRSLHDKVSVMNEECRRSNIMGELVQEASHFLFPCSIQYSLICSAILYIMWKNIGKVQSAKCPDTISIRSSITARRHNYQVDCAKANKGLFSGILVLVLSIISIILFFVLIGKPEYQYMAIIEAHITELVLYLVTSLAVAVALLQVRELKYNPYYNSELDNILLIVAQSGLYLFTMFSIIGGHFTMDESTLLVLVTSLACIIQATLQTVFVLDASKRYARTNHQARHKPGRELVTFLLVCNFAMWAMNTLQTQRADSNPVQLKFYGFWAWTIITHVTTPLAIYFRFHSIVCLCDIWKRTYKMKLDYL